MSTCYISPHIISIKKTCHLPAFFFPPIICSRDTCILEDNGSWYLYHVQETTNSDGCKELAYGRVKLEFTVRHQVRRLDSCRQDNPVLATKNLQDSVFFKFNFHWEAYPILSVFLWMSLWRVSSVLLTMVLFLQPRRFSRWSNSISPVQRGSSWHSS